MIQVMLTGGTGNQLFNWAYGRAAAKRTGFQDGYCTMNFSQDSHRQYMLGKLGLRLNASRWAVIYGEKRREHSFRFDPTLMKPTDGSLIYGYLQSWKYFADCEEDIRKELWSALIKSEKTDTGLNADQVPRPDSPTCFIHVRRGDYLLPQHFNFHGVMDMDYYDRAMSVVLDYEPRTKFYVFSDDTQWCSEKFPKAKIIQANEVESFLLMALCRHAIIANSSFSWWGAFLRSTDPGKLTIAPKRWFNNESMQEQTGDLIPPTWVTL